MEGWKDLLSASENSEQVVTTRVVACGAIGWSSNSFLLSSLKLWHSSLKPKEQRKNREAVIKVLVKISQNKNFPALIASDRSLSLVY